MTFTSYAQNFEDVRVLGRLLDRYTDISGIVVGTANIAISFVVVSLLFAAIYKLLPNRKLMWRDVLVASCGTALLFEAGQTFIGYYLANFITANIYGAAAASS